MLIRKPETRLERTFKGRKKKGKTKKQKKNTTIIKIANCNFAGFCVFQENVPIVHVSDDR